MKTTIVGYNNLSRTVEHSSGAPLWALKYADYAASQWADIYYPYVKVRRASKKNGNKRGISLVVMNMQTGNAVRESGLNKWKHSSPAGFCQRFGI